MFPYWYILTWTFKELINSLFFPRLPRKWTLMPCLIIFFFFSLSLRNAQGWTEPVSCTDHTSAHILNKPGSQEGEAVPYISPCLQPQALQEHQIRLCCSTQHPILSWKPISTTSSSAADGTRLPWARLFLLGRGQDSTTVSSEQLEKGKQRTGKQHLLLQPCLILCSRTKPLDTPIWTAQCAARTLKAFMSQSWNQKLQCVLIQLLTSVSLKAVTGHVFILSELYISAPITSNLSWGSPDK